MGRCKKISFGGDITVKHFIKDSSHVGSWVSMTEDMENTDRSKIFFIN